MAIIDINTHMPSEGQLYFFDCNVWMYLFYTNGAYASSMIAEYSSFVSKIKSMNAEIIITDVLISEFVNTYIQTEFRRLARLNGWPNDKKYFKNVFKHTNEYRDILEEIRCILERQLFPISKRENTDFKGLIFDGFFDRYATFDFNDRYYGMTLKNKSVYIVTNDMDFSDLYDCTIITGNRSLLQRGM